MDQVIAKWTDDRGANTLAGIAKYRDGRFHVLSLSGAGWVAVPDGAVVYRPQRPVMREVGLVVDGQFIDEEGA